MRYQKKQTWKKRMLAVIALLMAVIMVLGLFTPIFAASPVATTSTTVDASTTSEDTLEISQPTAQEMGSDRFSVKASLGFDGAYIVTCTTPLHLSITNLGNDFQGKVQVKTYLKDLSESFPVNTEPTYALYTQPLFLSSNATKGIDMEINTSTIQRSIEITLLDKNGTVVFLHNMPVQAISPESTTIGILSEQPAALDYLKNMHLIYTEKSKQSFFFLNADTFPKSQSVMENFHIMVIDDFDTKKLSAQQLQALQSWVGNGGMLVLGTGVHAQKVLSGLDFLGIQQNGSTQIQGSIQGNHTLSLHAPLQLSQLSAPHIEPIWQDASVKLTSLLAYGNGQVIIHHFAMGLAPFANAAENTSVLEGLYIEQTKQDLSTHNSQIPSSLSWTADRFEMLSTNNLWGILVILVIYVILIGPVLYYILKKKDIRNRGWIYIPTCSVIFVAVVFLFAKNSAYKSGLLNSAALVSIDEGSTIGQATGIVSIKAPTQGDVTLSIDGTPALHPYNDKYRYRSYNNTGVSYQLETGEQTNLTFYQNMAWESNQIRLSKTIDMGGEIESTVQYIDDAFVGTLTNHSNVSFIDTVLSAQGIYVQSGPLPAGKTVEINIPVTQQMLEAMYDPECIFFGDDTALNLVNKKKISRTDAYRMQQQSSLLEVFFENRTQQTMDSWESARTICSFYGFTQEPLIAENTYINGKQMQERNMTMYHKNFTIDLSQVKSFDLPFSILPTVDSNTPLGYDYNNGSNTLYMYGDGSQTPVLLYYAIDKNLRVDELQFRLNTLESEALPTEIYNTRTQTWEVLTEAVYPNPQDYINDNHQVQVRLYVIEHNQAPNMRVKGGGLYA